MSRRNKRVLAGLLAVMAGAPAHGQTVAPPAPLAVAEPNAPQAAGASFPPFADLDPGAGAGLNCAVRPLQVVNVAAPVNGIIAKVHVRPGQTVQAGQLLVSFDTTIAETDLALAEAREKDTSALFMADRKLQGLNAKLARLDQARASRAIPEADYEAAALDRDMAQGELAKARADHDEATIQADRARKVVDISQVHSPVAGTVAEGLIDPGEQPDKDQPIAVITVTDPLRIEAYVPAAELAAFLARPRIQARIGPGLYDLTRDYVASVADVSSGTVSVFFTLHAPQVLPGLDCVIPPLTTAFGG